MKDRRAKKLCTGLLCAAMIMAGLTGCGSESSESYTQVMGRVTAVSDSEITLAVFEQPEGRAASGGAVQGQDKPEGTPPAGMPEGGEPGENPPEGVSGEAVQGQNKPEGTPPAGMPEGGEPGEKTDSDRADGDKKTKTESTETKKITISSDTKVYTQQGEEKTETSLSEVELGSMVSVELDGEEAVSITLQTMNGRGGMRQKDSGTSSESSE